MSDMQGEGVAMKYLITLASVPILTAFMPITTLSPFAELEV